MAAAAAGMATQVAGTQPWSELVDEFGIDKRPGPVTATGPKAAEKWLRRSYKLWKQWTGYLVRESLIPHNQLSTDDFAGWLANQTNLGTEGHRRYQGNGWHCGHYRSERRR